MSLNKNIFRRTWVPLAVIIFYMMILSPSCFSCIGKKGVTLGYLNQKHRLLSRILGTYINERTGYPVTMKGFPSYKALLTSIRKGETSLAIGYFSYKINGFPDPTNLKVSSRHDIYKNLRDKFLGVNKLILLPPLGKNIPLSFAVLASAKIPAIIIKEKTTVAFPVLCRLLRNLSYKFNSIDMLRLQNLAKKSSLKKAAWEYLDKEGLI